MSTTAQTDLTTVETEIQALQSEQALVGVSLSNAAKAKTLKAAQESIATGEARLTSAQTMTGNVLTSVQAALAALNPTPPPPPPPTGVVPLPTALQSLALTLAFDSENGDLSMWAIMNDWQNNYAANVASVGARIVLSAPAASNGARIDSSAAWGAKPGFSLPMGGVVEFGAVSFPNPNVWATLWTCDETESSEAGGEVDVVEGGQGATAYHTNYHVGSAVTKNGIVTFPASLQSGEHTVTFFRGAGTNGYQVFLDGTLAGEWTGSDNGTGQAIIVSIGTTSGSYPAVLSLQYVRAWTPA
jgi:hypothetical protein